jgi:alkyl hydroperoxide reductase subunit AhpC
MKYDELAAMDCMVATLSVDPVKSHNEWLRDVVAHCENEIEVKFPIIGTLRSNGIFFLASAVVAWCWLRAN